MMPGMPRDPRQMQMMMRRLGMKTEEIDDVEEVVVRTRTKDHVFVAPQVTVITVQGARTYQVVGTPEIRARSAGPLTGGAAAAAGAPVPPPAPSGPPEEDIRLVMEQANVSHEEAVEALLTAHGEPAEAIMKILSRGGG
ncbi:MAG TPA: nascent polypeptide-associated complex protein [Thermoplasmata archaeon]|jgi:nascent polypeptide-associated complex subunit alpha|nr:nascent polypeptide-associated complex protein [Thermoplasmata archaeon]